MTAGHKDRDSDVDDGWSRGGNKTLVGTGKGTEHDPATAAPRTAASGEETREKHKGKTLMGGSPDDESIEGPRSSAPPRPRDSDRKRPPKPAREAETPSRRPPPRPPSRDRDPATSDNAEAPPSRRPPPRPPRSEAPPPPRRPRSEPPPPRARAPRPPRRPKSDAAPPVEDASSDAFSVPTPAPSNPVAAPLARPSPMPVTPAPMAVTPAPMPATPAPMPVAPRAQSKPRVTPGADFTPPPAPAFDLRSIEATCEAELAQKPDPLRAARLHHELARVAATPEAARRHFEQALAAAPDHLPSIRGARAAYLDRGDVKKAAELFDAEARLAPDKRTKAALAFAKGCAHLDVGRPDHARTAFAEAAALDDRWLVALKAHEHRELVAKDFGTLAQIYARQAAAIGHDSRHRAAVLAQRARLLERRLSRDDEAIEQLETALELDAYTPAALADLQRLLYAKKRWRELVGALEREASLTSDPVVQTNAWWMIARLQAEQLGNLDDAVAALEQASRIADRDPILLEELARAHQRAGDRSGEAAALERLSAVARPSDRLATFVRLGRLAEKTSDPEGAIRWYEAALALDGNHAPALRALDALYLALGRFAELAAVYARAGEADVGSAERAAHHARAAEIFDRHLARPDEAAAHYRHALALDAGHEGAFKALVRLHSQARRYAELVELYDRAVDAATSEDVAIAYLFKIGSIFEDLLGDLGGAVATYERILGRQSSHLGAIHALQRAAESAGDHEKLLTALDLEAKLESDRRRVTALEHRAAEVVAELLGDAEGALRRLEAIAKKSPKFEPALVSLGRLYARLGRHEDQLGVYERQLGVTDGVPAQVALLVEMAELCETVLGDRKRAIDHYRRAAGLDREHPLATSALQRLLREDGDHDRLAKVLSDELSQATAAAHKARVAFALGGVYESNLGKLEEAATAYRAALAASPEHRGALDGLARVLAQQSAWKDLDDVLMRAAGAVTDRRLALDARLRAAIIRADRLGKPEVAAEIIDELLEEDPRNLAALLTFETLCAAEEDRDRLDDVLSREADVFAEPGARVAALVQRGRQLEATGDDAALRSVCTAIVAIDPGNVWALEALARVALKIPDPHLLADVEARLCDVLHDRSLVALHATRLGDVLRKTNPSAALAAYRRAADQDTGMLAPIRALQEVGFVLGDPATMIEAYQREASWLRDDRAAADLLIQASVMQARLRRLDGAIEDAETALGRCPDHVDAAAQLEGLLVPTNQIDRLIEVLTRAAHAAGDKKRRVALWRRVGRLQADHREDIGAAIAAATRALEAGANDLETVLLLADLHMRDHQHEEAAKLLSRAVELDPAAVDAHRELARIYTEHLPNPEKAKKSLDWVLNAHPDDRDALGMLFRQHLAAGQRDAARSVSERLLAAAGDDLALRAWALGEIGRVEIEAGDVARPAEVLREAVVLEGPSGPSGERYRSLLGSGEPWDRYASALREHLARRPADPAAVYLALARAQHERMRQPQAALQTLEEAVSRHPDRDDLALARAELLAATGRGAAEAYRSVVLSRPTNADAWRGLVRAMQQDGRPGEAALAAGALVALRAATDVEKNLARERAPRPGAARPGSLAHPTLRAISAGSGDDEARLAELFSVHSDGIAKAFPAAYEHYGVRKGDRIKARAPHPIRQEIDRIAPVFGLEDFEVYVHAGLGGDATIELSDPPSIMVPTYFSDLPEAQRVCLLGRPLAAIASGLHCAYKLGPDEVAALVAASVRRIVPGFEEGLHDPERLAALSVHLSPSWFGRGRVDEAAQRYYAEPTDVRSWAPSVARTATRAAVLLAGDLGGAVEGLRAVGALETDPGLLEDLLRFWLGDEALEVRHLAGMR